MKISRRAASCVTLVLQVVAPALLVAGIRAISIHGGPARASAAPGALQRDQPAPAGPEEVLSLSDGEIDQLRLASTLSATPISRNPFVSSAIKSGEVDIKTLLVEEPTEDERPAAIEIPEIELTSIADGREKIAVINGRVSRIGDTILDGWTLREIDAGDQFIVLHHSTGVEQEYALTR
ncbi:MAG TPA: hypothetical protein VK176_13740 [Phycisphaerales bacterium]|nr:hypothetical protein [Phycisphaerales bacterium]